MYLIMYKARLKCLYKNSKIIFWSFGFPILLAVFYYLGFYNNPDINSLSSISLGVVKSNTQDNLEEELLKSFNGANYKGGVKLFSVDEVTQEEGEELLKDERIAGYIILNDTPTLIVKNIGLEQRIIKSYLDTFSMKNLKNSIEPSHNAAYKDFIIDDSHQYPYPNNTLIYFYSLVAFACILGSKLGFREMNIVRADQSSLGLRIHISSGNKIKVLLCHMASALTLHFLSVLFLLTFLIKILRIDFGGRLWMLILICLLGSCCGITLGAMICVAVKANERVREGILNGILLIGWFLSGMAITGMKYILTVNAPLLGLFNPFSLITDAFYYLYYYEGYAEYFLNLNVLILQCFLFGFIAYLELRRKDYASV